MLLFFSTIRLRTSRWPLPLAVCFLCSAAAAPPPPPARGPAPPPQRIFVYPGNGQSAEQTERDRYECHVWAVQQTGVDPSRAGASAYERVVVQPANPPGSGTVAGLIGGAIVGSIIGGPRNAGAGAIIGGATGAVIGSAADANPQPQAHQTHQQFNHSPAPRRPQAHP